MFGTDQILKNEFLESKTGWGQEESLFSRTVDTWSMGLLNQVLEPGIRPIDESKVLCGWAGLGFIFPSTMTMKR